MKKLAILSVVLALVISGCVQRVDFEDGPPTNVSDNVDTKTDIKSNIVENIERGTDTGRLRTSDENNVGSEGWCVPGNRVTVSGDEFVVVGIVSHKNRDDICKAVRITQDSSSTVYYNEGYATNGSDKFIEMISEGTGSVTSEVSVTVEG